MIFEQCALANILHDTLKQEASERPFDEVLLQALEMGSKVRGPYEKYKGRRRAAQHREALGEESFKPP